MKVALIVVGVVAVTTPPPIKTDAPTACRMRASQLRQWRT
jgi:hypothetical protein